MSTMLRPARNDRLLVFAPHPDDETLAAGALIQAARAAGAAVRVVVATDGDNNPWPQRWIERRLRIGADERRRWGERRRAEARAAFALLGVDAARDARFLGWPDQGLTALLMAGGHAVAALADEIRGFAPTHVVAPSLADRHPDHSALRVMIELALLRSGHACVRLGYVVHGEPAAPRVTISADAAARRRKCEAMRCHESQVALSRRRLMAVAERDEGFELAVAGVPAGAGRPLSTLRIPWRPRRRRSLLLVLATRDGERRYRCDLPARGGRAMPALRADDGAVLPLVHEDGALVVRLDAAGAPVFAAFAKVDRPWPRLVVFDHDLWLAADRADVHSTTWRADGTESVSA